MKTIEDYQEQVEKLESLIKHAEMAIAAAHELSSNIRFAAEDMITVANAPFVQDTNHSTILKNKRKKLISLAGRVTTRMSIYYSEKRWYSDRFEDLS